MFTGIIEEVGSVISVDPVGNNKTFWIKSSISNSLKADQSVSHDGVCLTIEEVKNGQHRVTAIAETLKKSNLEAWQPGTLVNLERCLILNDRIDGHLVQGHIDTTAQCLKISEQNGSWQYTFGFPESFQTLLIEKGSVSLNGISLTVFNVTSNQFEVGIIPFTLSHTNLKTLEVGSTVNLEFDMIGKYINRVLLKHDERLRIN